MRLILPPSEQRVALLGFGDFERSALVSYLRLSATRMPAYVEVESLAAADFVIADADHVGTIDAVLGADRVADTVFIGSLAPDAALAWLMRPIDPLQVFRELDAAVSLRLSQAQPPYGSRAIPPTLLDVVPVPANGAAPPAAATKPEAVPAAAERSSPRRAGDVRAPTAALLVDANESALRMLERQLQSLGLRTETASTSQRALEMLAQRPFDAVFLDLDLGPHSELDGLALCQHIKRQQRAPGVAAAVVIVASANMAATDRVRGAFAGCDAYLARPIDDDTLRRNLRKLGLRLATPADTSHANSRPGNLLSRPTPLGPSG